MSGYTPGLNESPQRAIPILDSLKDADAAIFMINATTPATETEKHMIEETLLPLGFNDLIMVANRIDMTRNREKVKLYIQGQVQGYTSNKRVFAVSAKEALEGIKNGNQELLDKSGMPEFMEFLTNYLTRRKAQLKLVKTGYQVVNSIRKDVLEDLIPKKLRDVDTLIVKMASQLNKMGILDSNEHTFVVRERKRISDASDELARIASEISLLCFTIEKPTVMQLNSVIDQLRPHILFARKEIETHSWDHSIDKKLRNLLKGLNERVDDPCINISVTGEFSSGKSSVINAILGMNLLATDEMPDTTLVPAIISYGSSPMIEIIYTDGRQVKKDMGINEIQSFLSGKSVVRNTGESDDEFMKRIFEMRIKAEKKASEIRQFNIGVPSEFLRAGFRIIDTPGLNSGNRRCADVTRSILTQTDASIIVGNATGGGLKDVLRDDFKVLLQHKLMHCLVVYTHYDQATRREKLARYLAGVTASYFDLTPDKLPVLMMVPPTIEASIQGKRIGDDFDEMLAVTKSSIHKIAEYAQAQRLLIIFQQLRHLTDELFSSLSQIIGQQESVGTERLNALKRNRTAPIDKFIDRIVPILKGQLDLELNVLKKRLSDSLNTVIVETKSSISAKMRCQENLDAFNEYVNSRLSNDISHGIKRLDLLLEGATNKTTETVEKFNNRFEHNLRNEFVRLNIIVDGIEFDNQKITLPKVSFSGSVNDAASIVGKEVNHENATYGGAIIGAIIGSIFTFGIGTAIGAAIGGLIFGRGRNASVDNAYKKLWPDFEKNFDDGFKTYQLQLREAYSSWCTSVMTSVESYYRSFVGRYKISVDRMIEQEQKNVNEVIAQIQEYQERLIEISKHKHEIDKIWKAK